MKKKQLDLHLLVGMKDEARCFEEDDDRIMGFSATICLGSLF
jgi:hypothetical protein